jgi:hypothetical protein
MHTPPCPGLTSIKIIAFLLIYKEIEAAWHMCHVFKTATSLVLLKLRVLGRTRERNYIAYIGHTRNELHHSLKS